MNKDKKNKRFRKSNAGFTLLFAVLVSSMVLALGMGILNITLKEILISGTGKDSQLAFYAADTGADCAVYWDFQGAIPTSTDSDPTTIECADQTISVVIASDSARSATSTMSFAIGTNQCAVVTIGKNDADDDGFSEGTVIESRGYNDDCVNKKQRRVERGYKITY